MTEPTDFELLELATPYALHAMSDEEQANVDRRVAAAPSPGAAALADEDRAVRQTLGGVSAATATEPPAHLRTATLGSVKSRDWRQLSWRTAALVSAAAGGRGGGPAGRVRGAVRAGAP